MIYKFPYKEALYRRNNFGQPTMWCATILTDNSIQVSHGIVDKTISTEYIITKRNVHDELKTRINNKRKTGYKRLDELKDNNTLPVEGELYNYLQTYLPEYRTTADGSLLPMLAKVYDNANNKLFKKVSKYLSQYKINGLRCFVSAYTTSDIFMPIRLKFQSKEGTEWTSLRYLEDYLLFVIPKELLTKMVEEHYILDGEIYLPGYDVNEINHFVKNPICKENKLLQYWCFDLAVDDYSQNERLLLLHNYFYKDCITFNSKEQHLNNKSRFVLLPYGEIDCDDCAVSVRNKYLDLGFEGLILRNPEAEYQYGKRNLSMIKFKRSTDGKFKIIDIYPEGTARQDVPLFLLKNDINDETFEVHLSGSLDYQKKILIAKNTYIGSRMWVEYGERSGVKQVPFHVKKTALI